jgi:hypothetical protein
MYSRKVNNINARQRNEWNSPQEEEPTRDDLISDQNAAGKQWLRRRLWKGSVISD